jgi:hypothetical protein
MRKRRIKRGRERGERGGEREKGRVGRGRAVEARI